MTVKELISELQKLPSHSDVRIAYDMGIRLDVEVCKQARDEHTQIVVLTDKHEWNDRENW